MTNFTQRLIFDASVEKVYEAITTEKGIKSWWTVDCDINNEVGGIHSFRFERLLFNSMQVVELIPNHKVHWLCVNGWNEWIGTEVLFTLKTLDNEKSELLFEHNGLVPSLLCYNMCSKGWNDTLHHLKKYVETGEALAHVPNKGLKGIISRTAFKIFSRKYTR
jgi:uncharacterized protein YndB with AHSA1/START domain